MYKNEWKYPLIALLILSAGLSAACVGVKLQEHRPSTKTYQLRNF